MAVDSELLRQQARFVDVKPLLDERELPFAAFAQKLREALQQLVGPLMVLIRKSWRHRLDPVQSGPVQYLEDAPGRQRRCVEPLDVDAREEKPLAVLCANLVEKKVAGRHGAT